MKMRRLIACVVSLLSLAVFSFGCYTGEDKKDLPELVIGGASHDPYFYTDANGRIAGVDVDIATEACRRMGYKPVFKTINWIEKNDLLNAGEIDCLWACYSMNGRESVYRWVGPYACDREVVAVAKNSNINSLAELENKTVVVQRTSKAEDVLLSRSNEKIPQLREIFTVANMGDAVSALRREKVDACTGHEAVLIKMLEEYAVEYRILDEELLISRMGVAFAPDYDGAAFDKLSAAIREMIADGSIKAAFDAHGVKMLEVEL